MAAPERPIPVPDGEESTALCCVVENWGKIRATVLAQGRLLGD